MKTCIFFGHRECPDITKQHLREVLLELIQTKEVEQFYVGHQGQFDALVRSVLRELEQEYPISYAVVLAYLPGKRVADQEEADTLFPEGIEQVPPRFAIDWRNRWMLKQADYIVAYLRHSWGGAAKFVEQAQRQRKQVFFL